MNQFVTNVLFNMLNDAESYPFSIKGTRGFEKGPNH